MSRPPRLHGFAYRGRYRYFLTFTTFQRRRALADDETARLVLQQFLRTAARHDLAILAYCLMPEHVHLLVEGLAATADLRRFIKSAKQSTGQRYAARTKQLLWNEGYHDHVVRPEENLLGFARYILENPVKAGLARTPDQYPYAGCVWPLKEVLDAAR